MRRPHQAYLVAVMLSIVGVVLILLTTRWGVGLSPDSGGYLRMARSLAAGLGISVTDAAGAVVPITGFAPGYPAALSVANLLGVDDVTWARTLGALLFGANLLLCGLIVARGSGGSPVTALLATALVLFFVDAASVHAMAWSEPLFMLCMLLGFVALGAYLERPALRWVLAAAVAVSLACLTRYVGAALIAGGALGIVLVGTAPVTRRLRDASLFGAIAALPLLAWMARNARVAGDVQPFARPTQAVGLSYFLHGAETMSTWLLPERIPTNLRLAALVATLAALAAWGRATARAYDVDSPVPAWARRLVALLWVTAVCYVALLAIVASLVSADVELGHRYLVPLYVIATIASSIWIRDRIAGGHQLWAVRCAVAAASALVLLHAARTASWARSSRREGLGYAAPQWRVSPLAVALRSLPSSVAIYSNISVVPYFLARRAARDVPVARSERTLTVDSATFRRERDAMLAAMRDGEAVVLLVATPMRDGATQARDLFGDAPYEMVAGTREGAVFRLARADARVADRAAVALDGPQRP